MPQRKQGEWVRLFQEQVERVVEADLLTRTQFRVWLYLMARATFAEAVPVTQQGMAHALGLRQSQVSASLRTLKAHGLVFETPTGARKQYSLNSQLVFKGTGDRLRQRRAYQAQRHVNGTAAHTPQPV